MVPLSSSLLLCFVTAAAVEANNLVVLYSASKTDNIVTANATAIADAEKGGYTQAGADGILLSDASANCTVEVKTFYKTGAYTDTLTVASAAGMFPRFCCSTN